MRQRRGQSGTSPLQNCSKISWGMMEAVEQTEAEIKFWKSPELLENLFPRLDLKSTLNLACVLDKESLQGGITSKVWNKLIRDQEYGLFEEARAAMKNLATILKLLQPKTQQKIFKDLLLDLLDSICERNPPYPAISQLQVACPRHPDPHNISPFGFLCLEEVESVLGTAEQWIQSGKWVT